MPRVYSRPAPIEGILLEHIDEAAFLQNCRTRVFIDPERSWVDLGDFERRMFPHLHGLVLGGSVSAGLLKEKLTLDDDGDPGEAFVAATLYPTLDLVEPMQWLKEAMAQEPPHLTALIDGLKLTRGTGIDGWLEDFLEHEASGIQAVGAEVIGYRGLSSMKEKLVRLQSDPVPRVSLEAMASLDAMGSPCSRDALLPHVSAPEPSVRVKAIELLLRIGDRDAVALCRENCAFSGAEVNRRFVYYLAVAGTIDDMGILCDVMRKQPEILHSCLLALGLCGNIEAVDLLIACLDRIDDPDEYIAAYQGLRMITGMDLIPQFDLSEAEPVEIQSFRDAWREWWERNRNRFSREEKWRGGERISPAVLHRDAMRSGNPCRDMVDLEMVVRYRCPERFRHDHFQEVQARQLQAVGQWAGRENGKFQPGLSYFHALPST
ncbi:MAG: hypothetical protein E4H29_00025 [Deltaproteobacteria bacterium]|nr:MAG: hypothetical protein E4H29_00025 [Deltaproteobacteria bacterium]